jgi:hypothetical protein
VLCPVLQEVDKVELVYTKFISLISGSPVIQTLLPLTPSGEVRPHFTPALHTRPCNGSQPLCTRHAAPCPPLQQFRLFSAAWALAKPMTGHVL